MPTAKTKPSNQLSFTPLLLILSLILLILSGWTGISAVKKYHTYHQDAYVKPLNKTLKIQAAFEAIFQSVSKTSNQRQGHWSISKQNPPVNSTLIYTSSKNNRQQKATLPLKTLIDKTYDMSYRGINKITLFDTRTGDIIASPSEEYVLTKNIHHIAPGSQPIIKQMEHTHRRVMYASQLNDTAYHLAFIPIRNTPFALVISFQKNLITSSLIKYKHTLNLTLILFSLALLFGLTYLYCKFKWTYTYAWLISLGFTVIGICIIIAIIKNASNLSSVQITKAFKPIITQSQIKHIKKTSQPIKLGIQVFAIDPAPKVFPDSILVNGVIWEKVPLAEQTASPSFFILNRQQDTKFKKLSEIIVNKNKIVKWWFEARVSSGDYSALFPFGEEDTHFYFAPKVKESSRPIIPLLNDYTDLNPTLLPGIHKNLNLSNQLLTQSFFSQQKLHLDYNYDHSTPLTSHLNTLTYHIVTKPYLTPILLVYILPCIVIYTMLFCYLMFLYRNKKEKKSFKDDLVYFSALFITLAITNASFISSVGTKTLTYLDFFFIIGYVLVLITTIMSAYFNSREFGPSEHQKLTMMRRCFWPVITAFWMIFSFIWLS